MDTGRPLTILHSYCLLLIDQHLPGLPHPVENWRGVTRTTAQDVDERVQDPTPHDGGGVQDRPTLHDCQKEQRRVGGTSEHRRWKLVFMLEINENLLLSLLLFSVNGHQRTKRMNRNDYARFLCFSLQALIFWNTKVIIAKWAIKRFAGIL